MTNSESIGQQPASSTSPPVIGVFDSGAGGLTVLRALRARLPQGRYIYLGDTARLPYGSKSQQTVARYAVESARFLVAQGAECLVIACNTASALALPEIRSSVAPVQVFGVIEAGAENARARSASGDVCVHPRLPDSWAAYDGKGVSSARPPG
jgi:glutamate racemase